MAKNRETLRRLWAHPLKEVARNRKGTPEAWHAECLSEERDELQVAVRALEFSEGFLTGRSVGRVEGVLVDRLAEAKPGAAAVAADLG